MARVTGDVDSDNEGQLITNIKQSPAISPKVHHVHATLEDARFHAAECCCCPAADLALLDALSAVVGNDSGLLLSAGKEEVPELVLLIFDETPVCPTLEEICAIGLEPEESIAIELVDLAAVVLAGCEDAKTVEVLKDDAEDVRGLGLQGVAIGAGGLKFMQLIAH